MRIDAIRIRPKDDHTEIRVYYSGATKQPTPGEIKKAARPVLEKAQRDLKKKLEDGGNAGTVAGYVDLLAEEE